MREIFGLRGGGGGRMVGGDVETGWSGMLEEGK